MLGGPPCHHSILHHRVGDGRDCFQLWRLAANILDKKPWINDKGRSSSLGVELTTPHRTKRINEPRSWTDSGSG
jgi:hypothetical protein